jgi:thiosulfate reductase cytochrome b subunit
MQCCFLVDSILPILIHWGDEGAQRPTLAREGSMRSGLCYSRGVTVATTLSKPKTLRHSGVVRVTHWITVAAFFALLVSGGEILISHPRFYWGEAGNVMMRPLFTLPIPASRDTVPTGFGYVLPDQNGWSRSLHFQAAWAAVLTGLVYGIASLWNGHFRKDLLPKASDWTWRTIRDVLAKSLHRAPPEGSGVQSYNVVQRSVYLSVIFLVFPLIIWTGLAMSPAFVSAWPLAVTALGGRQSARTLHFFLSGFLLLFVVVHVTMVVLAGFRSRMRAMITGRPGVRRERA